MVLSSLGHGSGMGLLNTYELISILIACYSLVSVILCAFARNPSFFLSPRSPRINPKICDKTTEDTEIILKIKNSVHILMEFFYFNLSLRSPGLRRDRSAVNT